jgi:hypothetical protein
MSRKLQAPADTTGFVQLPLQRGANLNVGRFPSFGGCTDQTPSNRAGFAAARVSSVFKYAGIEGAGNSGTFLTDDISATVPGAAGDDLQRLKSLPRRSGPPVAERRAHAQLREPDLVAEPGQQDDRCVASRACGARRQSGLYRRLP